MRNLADRERARRARRAIFSATGGSPIDYIEHACSAPSESQPALIREAAEKLASAQGVEAVLSEIAERYFTPAMRDEPLEDEDPESGGDRVPLIMREGAEVEDDGSRSQDDVLVAARVIASATAMNEALAGPVRKIVIPKAPSAARELLEQALEVPGVNPSDETKAERDILDEAMRLSMQHRVHFSKMERALRTYRELSAVSRTRVPKERWIALELRRIEHEETGR